MKKENLIKIKRLLESLDSKDIKLKEVLDIIDENLKPKLKKEKGEYIEILEGCEWLTKGKLYKVHKDDAKEKYIVDDDGERNSVWGIVPAFKIVNKP